MDFWEMATTCGPDSSRELRRTRRCRPRRTPSARRRCCCTGTPTRGAPSASACVPTPVDPPVLFAMSDANGDGRLQQGVRSTRIADLGIPKVVLDGCPGIIRGI